MSGFDLVLIFPLLVGAYKGYQRGFVLEIITFLALVFGVLGAFKLLHWGMDVLDNMFSISGNILPFVAFLVLFIGIVILINLLGRMARKLIEVIMLGSVDSLAGGIFGFLKWAFALSVLLWLLTSWEMELPVSWRETSILYPYLVAFAPGMFEILSPIFPFAESLFSDIKDVLQS